MKKYILIFIFLILATCEFQVNAQSVGIGTGTFTPDASSMLEIQSTTKGLLIPRVALTQTTSANPITSPVISLLIYNTATINDVKPGYYYWDGSKWVRFISLNSSSGTLNYVPKWTPDGTTLGNSQIFDNGNVGIGTTSPGSLLQLSNTNQYRVYVNEGNISSANYYYLGDINYNNGMLHLSGILGGHTLSQGRATIDISFSKRDGFTALGDVWGTVGTGSDILVYDDAANSKYKVYLKTFAYGLVNLALDASPGASVGYTGTILSVAPVYTLIYTLSTDAGQIIRSVNNGNIGIGKTNPAYKLDITGQLQLTAVSSAAPIVIPTAYASGANVTNLSSDLVDGYHAGNASGNVSLSNGTINTDLNSDLLDGQHASYFAPSTGSGNYIQNTTTQQTSSNYNISGNGIVAGSLQVGVNGAPSLTIDAQGSIGIKNTANWDHLYFIHDGATACIKAGGAENGLSLQAGNGATGSYGGQTYTDVMRLLPNGNVGIGTASPATKLQVNGPSAQINNTVWGWNSVLGYPTSTTYYKIATLPSSNSGTYDHIVIEGVFDDNWGSSQKAPFNIYLGNRNGFSFSYDMYGNVRQNARIVAYQESDNSVSVYLYHAASSYTTISYNIINSLQSTVYPNPSSTTTAPTGTLVFDSYTTTPRFIINNAGNVGIGTANPGAKLEVNGQVKITGGNPGNRKVLTSDAAGLATWQYNNGVPIGSIIAWNKNMSGTPALPAEWVECNGQVLSDAESPLNGQTIPNLNSGANSTFGTTTNVGRYLRGSTSSGSYQSDVLPNFQIEQSSTDQGANGGTSNNGSTADYSPWMNNYYSNDSFRWRYIDREVRPLSYTIVWIMKVK